MNKKLIITLLALLIVQVIQAQNNAIFFGGVGDGHSSSVFSQAVNEINKGGDGDGWTTTNYIQASNNINLGGDGDGFSSLNYIQLNDNSIFIGGDGNGFVSQSYMQIADSGLFRGGDGDGWASIVYPLGPLPVQLISFDGYQQNTNDILHWETATEVHTSHFVIEHSTNAQQFFELGMVTAKGSDSKYSFTNKKPVTGNNFYRLKIVDEDGKYTYSNIVLLKRISANAFINLYPSPANNILHIDVASFEQNTKMGLEIYNMQAQKIVHKEITKQENIIDIDIQNFAAGNYVLYFTTSKEKTTIKFSVVK